uniref:Aprataxin and PNK-like factor n=1 Tax=Microcebus murinus TaxID=30608 RepID=A0A8C5XBL5_MICMU
MSGGFELQPQDGGPRVALAPGETVIGRGPLLGITDKRVSRRHAILEVVSGQLRIKPIHTNPCFYQSSEKSQLLPLKTNLWRWLNPGDSFSLLVDKYIFRVLSTHSEMEMECTLRNSQMLDEDDILKETPNSPVINLPDETTGASQLERSTEITETQTTTTESVSFLGECRDFSKQQTDLSQRKRILPAWMLAENLSDQNLSAPVISGDNNVIQGSGKEGICKDKTKVNIIQQGRKRLISSGSSESTSAEQDTGKKSKNANQEESVISSKNSSICAS